MKKTSCTLLALLLALCLLAGCAGIPADSDPADSSPVSSEPSAAEQESAPPAQEDDTPAQSGSESAPAPQPGATALMGLQKNGVLTLDGAVPLDVQALHYTRVFGAREQHRELPEIFEYRQPYIYYTQPDSGSGAVTVGRFDTQTGADARVAINGVMMEDQCLALLGPDRAVCIRIGTDAAQGGKAVMLSELDFAAQTERLLLTLPADRPEYNTVAALSDTEAVFLVREQVQGGTRRSVQYYSLAAGALTELYRGPVEKETDPFAQRDAAALDAHDGKIFLLQQQRDGDRMRSWLQVLDAAGALLEEQELTTALNRYKRTDDHARSLLVTAECILPTYAKGQSAKNPTAVLQLTESGWQPVATSTLTAQLGRCRTSQDAAGGPVCYWGSRRLPVTSLVVYDPATLTLTALELEIEGCTNFRLDLQGNLLLSTRTGTDADGTACSAWYLYPAAVLQMALQAAE